MAQSTNRIPPKFIKKGRAVHPKGGKSAGARTGKRTFVNTERKVALATGAHVQVRPMVMKPGTNGNIHVTGTDWLGKALWPSASATAGQEIFKIVVSPNMTSNSRLAELARLYEYYRVHNLVFHFVSSMPATSAGAYIMYFDYDAEDDLAVGDVGIQTAFGHAINRTGKVFESVDLRVGPDPSKLHREKYTRTAGANAADAELDFGTFRMLSMDAGTVTAGQTVGSFYVSYDLELYGPTFEPPAPSGAYIEGFQPIVDLVAGGVNAAVCALNLVSNVGTGNITEAAKDFYELATVSGKMAGSISRTVSNVKLATNWLASVFGVNGNSTNRYGDMMLFQPGYYHVTLTATSADSSGSIVTTNMVRNGGGNRGYGDQLIATWKPEYGSPDLSQPSVYQGRFYQAPGANSPSSTVSTGTDYSWIAEIKVVKTAWVGFGLRNYQIDTATTQAFTGPTHVRYTYFVRKMLNYSVGTTWDADLVAGNRARNDVDDAPYFSAGGYAWQAPDWHADAKPDGPIPEAAAVVAPSAAARARPEDWTTTEDSDREDDTVSRTSSKGYTGARVVNRRA